MKVHLKIYLLKHLKQVTNLLIIENTTYMYTLGTYDLQSLSVHNVTSQTICFDFRFVIGKLTSAVLLVIVKSDSMMVSYHRNFSNESCFNTECYNVDGITFIQKVLACDGLGMKCDSPAFVLENISIPELSVVTIPTAIDIHSTTLNSVSSTFTTDSTFTSNFFIPSTVSATMLTLGTACVHLLLFEICCAF